MSIGGELAGGGFNNFNCWRSARTGMAGLFCHGHPLEGNPCEGTVRWRQAGSEKCRRHYMIHYCILCQRCTNFQINTVGRLTLKLQWQCQHAYTQQTVVPRALCLDQWSMLEGRRGTRTLYFSASLLIRGHVCECKCLSVALLHTAVALWHSCLWPMMYSRAMKCWQLS